jgi:2-keto-3-deoxy-L-rhamnonate aldolase RhmA
MLTSNRLRQQLAQQQTVFGLIASVPAPIMVEMIAYAGFDFVIIDMEHVMINPETVEHMIRAAEQSGITPLVRIPEINAKVILRVLDSGAMGIVIPQVETKEQIEAVIQAAKYFPIGQRSMNSGRPGVFGRDNLVDYMDRANQEIMIVPMIETVKGVEHIHEILSIKGIDMVLEGAADLSQSYGVPWQTEHPHVRQALDHIQQVAAEQQIPYCAIPRQPDQYDYWQGKGVQAYVLGDERGIAFRALQTKLAQFPVASAIPSKEQSHNHQ